MRISNLLYRSYLNCGKISGFVNHYRHKQFNSSCRNYDKVIRKKTVKNVCLPIEPCADHTLRHVDFKTRGFSLVYSLARHLALSLSALVAVLLLFFHALAV